jgi:hypothetical protein
MSILLFVLQASPPHVDSVLKWSRLREEVKPIQDFGVPGYFGR